MPVCDRLNGATFFVGQRGSIHEKFSCLIIETAPDNLDYRIWLFLGFLFFRVDFGISTFPSVNWLYISWFPPFLFLAMTVVGNSCPGSRSMRNSPFGSYNYRKRACCKGPSPTNKMEVSTILGPVYNPKDLRENMSTTKNVVRLRIQLVSLKKTNRGGLLFLQSCSKMSTVTSILEGVE